MKIKTKLSFAALANSIITLAIILWLSKDTHFFHDEDFQIAVSVAAAATILFGLVSPLLSSRWIFLNQSKQIKNLCADIQQGNYRFFDLPNEPVEKEDENELTSLMRDMNWMINQICIRETQLQDMIVILKSTKELIQKSEIHYHQLVENMGDIVFTVDLNRNIIFISSRIKMIIGYKPEEMIGKDIKKFLTAESLLVFEENFKRQIRNETIYPYEIEFVSADKQLISVEINTSRFLNIEGLLIGLEGIARDMTDRKRLETELFQARKMEAIGTLAGGIAHDFNNIIQGISGFTELLLINKTKNDPDYEKLTNINSQAFRAGELTSQLLTFSRKVESRFQPLNLNMEIEGLKKILTGTIPKMINIEFYLSDNLKPVNADPVQMEQIIINLSINAKDAMPDGGKLALKTENIILDEKDCQSLSGAVPGEYVLLTVTDTGFGIARETVEHIFDPFYTTKDIGKGTGLGLSMVYGIVKNHNGFICCESIFGQGAAFKIYLPVIKTKNRNQKTEQKGKKEIPAGGNETILLVDDDKVILNVGNELLKHFGYTVITAQSGEDAIKIIIKVLLPDLVILDLNMPGMGGYKCLQKLLKIDPEIKVLIASGLTSEYSDEFKKKIQETGARGFITKPYRIKQLLKTVREMLNKRVSQTKRLTDL